VILSFNGVKVVEPAQALKHVLLIEHNRRAIICYDMQIESSTRGHLVGVFYHLP
jgi:hypothetical protein